MLELFSAYKKYPYTVPARVRFFNLFRYFFKIPFLERILLSKILGGKIGWKKFIPPIYFYEFGTIRKAERNGIKYLLDLSCLIDHSIFFCNLKEPAWDNLSKVLHPNFTVLDIGANIGYLTLNFARFCSQGFVLAFEPDSKTFKSLKANINENNFTNIKPYQIALGERPDKMILHKLEKNNPGSNRILPPHTVDNHDQEWVDVCSLDQIADQLAIHRIDLMKIDVEGFEIFVLKGSENLIKKWRPILFVELAEVNLKQQGFSSRILIEYIESLNYEVKDARTMTAIDKFKTDYHTDILCFSNLNTSK